MVSDRFRVLLVNDEPWVLEYLRQLLEPEGYELFAEASVGGGLTFMSRNDVDLVVSDIHLEAGGGMELLREIRGADDPPETILITGFPSVDGAVQAMKEGAFDYLTKPLDSHRTLSAVRHALDRRALVREVRTLRAQMAAAHGDDRFVVVSREMQRLMATVDAVGKTDATVLIEGESGTGKEIIARTIHRSSLRADGPFVPVNCAALPESLMESELFGYEKGAFTGATAEKQGLFEAANGGTMLLDEIGELPLPLQATLLRVLQEGELRRVGGTKTRKIDVRLIASTNRSLQAMVNEGSFREALYYRFRVVPLVVPALRHRTEDILPLARFFLDKYSRRFGKAFTAISTEAAEFLLGYDWPGNIRELENLVHGAVALFDAQELSLEHVNTLMHRYEERARAPENVARANGSSFARLNGHVPAVNGANGQPRPVNEADDHLVQGPNAQGPYVQHPNAQGHLVTDRDQAEKAAIAEALRAHDGRPTPTATALGISRTSLWRKMKKHGLL